MNAKKAFGTLIIIIMMLIAIALTTVAVNNAHEAEAAKIEKSKLISFEGAEVDLLLSSDNGDKLYRLTTTEGDTAMIVINKYLEIIHLAPKYKCYSVPP